MVLKEAKIMAAKDSLIRHIGKAVKEAARKRGSEWWYTPHMAAAARAIAERIPLVDIVLEVRDARIPLSSEYEQLKNVPSSTKRIIVLNKMDLAGRSQTKEWIRFFENQKFLSFGVNSHNKENIKEFLNFLQARVRELKEMDHPAAHTISLMLVGIPNAGKSALANSLHQVGRISAAEKGRLKHCTVSPQPGETQTISSLKIASHPNIYVLDTPGVLPPELDDDGVCTKLALTGAIKDSVVGEIELTRYFLSLLGLGDEYKKWGKILNKESGRMSNKRQYPTDHTQDFIVNNARSSLFEVFSSFTGDVEDDEDLAQILVETFKALTEVFHIPQEESEECNYRKVAVKLLNLYRTGRLGYYNLDPIPRNDQQII